MLAAVKDMAFSEDIETQVRKDIQDNFMVTFGKLNSSTKCRKSLTRRIPVREERQAGWRTRTVDHETESRINEATRPADTVRNDSLDILVFMLTFLLAMGVDPEMWKRDISSAFRRVPILATHLDLAWAVWQCGCDLFAAGHLGMHFGTVNSVYAWHRVGHALWYLVVVGLRAPMGR